MPHSPYILDGQEIPSVTEGSGIIDKPYLRHWHAKEERLALLKALDAGENLERFRKKKGCFFKCYCEAKGVGDISRKTGNRVHDAIEKYLKGEALPTLPQNEEKMFGLFKDWRERTGFRPVELERKVVSTTYKFHGTFDALGTFEFPSEVPDLDISSEDLVMCDWKTSNGEIDHMYALQPSAYSAAYEEETGLSVVNGLIVRMDKKGLEAKKPFEVRGFKNLPAYFDVFLDCLSVWNFVNKKDKWGKAA